jgi:hypothetical protein
VISPVGRESNFVSLVPATSPTEAPAVLDVEVSFEQLLLFFLRFVRLKRLKNVFTEQAINLMVAHEAGGTTGATAKSQSYLVKHFPITFS